jgi:hypothetical protein
MTLQVPIQAFPQAVAEHLGANGVFLTSHLGFALATAASVDKGVTIAAIGKIPLDRAATILTDAGLTISEGVWHVENLALPDESHDCYVAAVSYVSAEERPGVWVDAYVNMPTQVQVLMAMYDELIVTGELREVNFETFVELAKPNVAIVTPREIEAFLAQKDRAC